MKKLFAKLKALFYRQPAGVVRLKPHDRRAGVSPHYDPKQFRRNGGSQ